MLKYLLPILLLLGACAHKNSPSNPHESDQVEQLREKYDTWIKALGDAADKNTGWFSNDCDGTIWEGESVAAGFPSQLGLAEWEPGEVHRRPKAAGECYPDESKSMNSPDMRQGYMTGMFAAKDAQALSRLEAYGRKHNWIMGLPTDDPVSLMRPTEVGLLYRMLKSLGQDADSNGRDKVGVVCAPVFKDFEYHVQTLVILADGEASSGISDFCLEALKSNASLFPSDALLQAAKGVYTGDLDAAIKLLLMNDDYQCPSYVRPVPAYCTVHKAFAAKVVLKRFDK